jgi:hypothetical protein
MQSLVKGARAGKGLGASEGGRFVFARELVVNFQRSHISQALWLLSNGGLYSREVTIYSLGWSLPNLMEVVEVSKSHMHC